jgi:hypothetical protein
LGQAHYEDESSVYSASVDPFVEISRLVLVTLEKRGGKAEFSDMEKWADSTQIGKYTLRTIVSDLIGTGKLKAPDGFLDNDGAPNPKDDRAPPRA